MTLEDRLRRIVGALPTEASVTLPVVVLRSWLEDAGDDPLDDLTVTQVASRLNRACGTVRAWIRSGALDAYTLGREYRVTRSALSAFREKQPRRRGSREMPRTAAPPSANLGAWRKARAPGE